MDSFIRNVYTENDSDFVCAANEQYRIIFVNYGNVLCDKYEPGNLVTRDTHDPWEGGYDDWYN